MTEGAPGPPIFVVGAPRSGTTMLRLILDSHSRISCGPESDLMAEMHGAAERAWGRLQRYGYDKDYWSRKCARFVAEMKEEYAASWGKVRWADKTPTNGLHLPFIDALFPDAVVINMVRDVRLVTASAYNRFGWGAAWGVIETWAASMRAAREFGVAAGAGRYREIRFEELTTEPEPILRALFEWLDEPWEPAVMDYDTFDHDRGKTPEPWMGRVSRASGGGAINPERATKPRKQLDPLLRARVELVAGRLNRQLGYTGHA